MFELKTREAANASDPAGKPAFYAGVAADLRAYQALDGEEGHLRVVGDRAAPPVRGHVVHHAVRPVGRLDRAEGVELDPRTESVADRAAEQAAAHTAAEVLLLRASPDCRQSGPLRSSPDPVRSRAAR